MTKSHTTELIKRYGKRDKVKPCKLACNILFCTIPSETSYNLLGLKINSNYKIANYKH